MPPFLPVLRDPYPCGRACHPHVQVLYRETFLKKSECIKNSNPGVPGPLRTCASRNPACQKIVCIKNYYPRAPNFLCVKKNRNEEYQKKIPGPRGPGRACLPHKQVLYRGKQGGPAFLRSRYSTEKHSSEKRVQQKF